MSYNSQIASAVIIALALAIVLIPVYFFVPEAKSFVSNLFTGTEGIVLGIIALIGGFYLLILSKKKGENDDSK